MIRLFDLRDVALVRRLSERGVSLHTEPALTDSVHPLRGALLSIVGGDFPTYVWKGKDRNAAGFIQLLLEKDGQHAHILCLGSTEAEASRRRGKETGRAINEDVWLPLLEQAVVDIGRRGIHSLVAEVGETGDELTILRRAGFAVYTRQDIWVLGGSDHTGDASILSPHNSADDWDLHLLYANTVPRLVQLVEPMLPLSSDEIWVLREDGELTAVVHLHTGSVATWMRFYIHPNAEAQADEIIAAALMVVPRKTSHLIYCCVRRYQSWLQAPMERAGFVLWGSQAVMVKHTVHHQKRPMPELTAALDAQGIPVSAPMVQRYHWPKNGRTRNNV
jgi:hypothetical protein